MQRHTHHQHTCAATAEGHIVCFGPHDGFILNARFGQWDVVKCLIDKGVDVKSEEDRSWSGCAMLPDGKVVLVPYSASAISVARRFQLTVCEGPHQLRARPRSARP